MQLVYAQQVNKMTREWGEHHSESFLEEFDFELMVSIYSESDLDEVLALYKMFENLKWAREKNNKYLLKEELDAFPCMNYTLKEGPYVPPLDAKFGAEDQHVVLKGRDDNLFFFQTQLYGFKRGWYVETHL